MYIKHIIILQNNKTIDKYNKKALNKHSLLHFYTFNSPKEENMDAKVMRAKQRRKERIVAWAISLSVLGSIIATAYYFL